MTTKEAQTALANLKLYISGGGAVDRGTNNAIDMAIKALEKPEPRWTPVAEDTPKEAGTYMCTCYDAGRRIVTLAKWQPRTKTWNLTGARAYWKVIAWCKCPEPYKGVTT